MSKVIKLIHAFEQLGAIEAETSPFKKLKLLEQYGTLSPLSFLLSLNFNHDIKLELPEGMPAIEPKHMSIASHPDMMGLLGGSIGRLKNCQLGIKIPQRKKQELFYDALINCPMKDAIILCACKDHGLEEDYPSITYELVETVFPTYVSKREVAKDIIVAVAEDFPEVKEIKIPKKTIHVK